MTGAELWNAFIQETGHIDCGHEEWAFGINADQLAQLVRKGEKTATASAYPLYEIEKEPLPAVGEYSVILDSREQAVCVIRTTKVYVAAFNEVPATHAFKEGEGDKSLAYWREIHKKCFSQWLEEAGLPFTGDTKVVCEEFAVVYSPWEV